MKEYLKCIYVVIFLFPILVFGQVDSGFVDIKGGVLYYRIYGAGEPMVFLNGGPGFSSKGYEMYAETFASDKRKVILFDQRGTGKSKLKKVKNGIIRIKDMVKDIEKLRTHLNIEKWDVMGHSFGGHYAMAYTMKYPESIKKMILSATPNLQPHKFWSQNLDVPPFEKMTQDEQEVFLEIEKERKKKIPNQGKLKRLNMGLKARFYVYKTENYRKAMEWFIYKCEPRMGVITDLGHLTNSRNQKKLKKFQNPVLIIHGISDFINVSAPIANNKMFPNSELKIVYDSGHMILMDQPEEYKATIEAFLDKE